MSLWTPDGEVPVDRRPSAPTTAPGGASHDPGAEPEGTVLGGIDLGDLSPEERERAEQMLAEMAETQRRLAAMPAAEVVANHAMGLYELAAIHLSQPTPQLDDAQVAIDALAAIVDAVGERFGENLAVLREARQNLQLAYIQLRAAHDGGGGGEPSPAPGG